MSAEPNGELTAPPTAAFELASFETPVVSHEVLPPVKWSMQKYDVAQLVALSSKKLSEISKITKVPLSTIQNWMKNKEFSDYINKLTMESVNILKGKRIRLLTKMLDARIEEAESEDGSYAKLSQKDTLLILKELREETEESEKAKESNYATLLEKILLKSVPSPIIDVSPTS